MAAVGDAAHAGAVALGPDELDRLVDGWWLVFLHNFFTDFPTNRFELANSNLDRMFLQIRKF